MMGEHTGAVVAPTARGGEPTGADLPLFLLMSLIWGSTWIAAKVGIGSMPPVLFSAVRYTVVGVVLLVAVRGIVPLLRGRLGGQVLVTGLLVNTGTYALLLWGMQHVATGVAGLVNMTMIVVGLYGLALLRGEEVPSWRHAMSLLLGIGGLVALFAGRIDLRGNPMELWGILAIILGSLCYCMGSVLSRPLLATANPLQLTGAQALTGAVGLIALSGLLEPLSLETLHRALHPAPLASLGFMVVFGTFVAYTIYLRLMRNWGSARAGLYAFVSPVVALVLGHLVFGEALGPRQILGAALMLGAAALAVRRPDA